jgi:hypothetical protein
MTNFKKLLLITREINLPPLGALEYNTLLYGCHAEGESTVMGREITRFLRITPNNLQISCTNFMMAIENQTN